MSGQTSAGTRNVFHCDMAALDTFLDKPRAASRSVKSAASLVEPATASQARWREEVDSSAMISENDTTMFPKTKPQSWHNAGVVYAELMTFGGRLRAAREAKGLSGEAVGMKLAVTKATVSKWEKEVHDPGVEQIKALCRIYGVTPDWLFEWAHSDLPPDALAEAKVYAKLSPEDKKRWKVLRMAMFSTVE